MKLERTLAGAVFFLLLLAARAPATTYLILPFENQTKNASLEWIGESFVESLGERLASSHAYIVTREERAAGFDRLGIPASTTLSHATTIRLAETMDADYVVMGNYALSASDELQVNARVLEMRPLRLSARYAQSGPLPDLLDIQDRLGQLIARTYPAESETPPATFTPLPRVRLDAWENYIRGLTAAARPQQIKYFREATRLEPGFSRASLLLGKIYYQSRDYTTAVLWLSKLKEGETGYLEARFLLGICSYFLDDYEKAEASFQTVAASLPLNEVINNLGAAQSRRSRRGAQENFRKAAESDPTDPDYQFNLGYWYWKNGQYAQAVRRLRLALERRPTDVEARALVMRALEASGAAAEAAKERELLSRNPAAIRFLNPGETAFDGLERIKRNYDEPSFRQLQMTLQTLTDESLARLPKAQQAQVHLDRGRDLFLQQSDVQALPELQRAARLNPTLAEPHLLLARIHERNGRADEAIAEALAVLKLEESADAHLLLAKIYLQQNKLAEARQEAQEALALEPGNVAAMSVLKTVGMRNP